MSIGWRSSWRATPTMLPPPSMEVSPSSRRRACRSDYPSIPGFKWCSGCRIVISRPCRHAASSIPPILMTGCCAACRGCLALTAGLITGDPALLGAAHGDEIHEQPRDDISPEVAGLIEIGKQAGALHAARSGAGPSVMRFAPADQGKGGRCLHRGRRRCALTTARHHRPGLVGEEGFQLAPFLLQLTTGGPG